MIIQPLVMLFLVVMETSQKDVNMLVVHVKPFQLGTQIVLLHTLILLLLVMLLPMIIVVITQKLLLVLIQMLLVLLLVLNLLITN